MMNKSIVLIQLLISSGLSNPIDTTYASSDVGGVEDVSQITSPLAHVAVNADEETALVSKTVDNIISSSEIIKVNNIDKVIGDDKVYSKALEEDNQHLETKSMVSTYEPEARNIEPETKVGTSTQSLHLEEKKAIGIESVTSIMEDDSTLDYIENPTDSGISSKIAAEEESITVKSKLAKPSDESNDSWDVLDDLILTRRKMSDSEGPEEERKPKLLPDSVVSKAAEPQEFTKSTISQNEEIRNRKGKDDIQIIRVPNISNDPERSPLYQSEQLPNYFVNPVQTNEDSRIFRITDYPLGPENKRYLPPNQNPLNYKEHTHNENHRPIQYPAIPSYNFSPPLQSPIDKSAYVLSKLFEATEQPIRNGRRMTNNPAEFGTPKFLNINLPKLASSCGVTRACALFTI